MSGGAPGEEHDRGRCGPCAECRQVVSDARPADRLLAEHGQLHTRAVEVSEQARKLAHTAERLRRELAEAEDRLSRGRQEEKNAWEAEERALQVFLKRRADEKQRRAGEPL